MLEPVRDSAFGLTALAQRLRRGEAVFSNLRELLRLRHGTLRNRPPRQPGSPASEVLSIAAMADRLQSYRQDLQDAVAAQGSPRTGAARSPERVVLRYLDQYQHQLFGHPAARDDDGRVVRIVERTNNPAEQFFSGSKGALRRRVGRVHLGRDMQDQPAEACLAANLTDPDYVRIVCGGTLEDLPLQFAALVRSGTATARPSLNRDQRNSDLRQIIRGWEKETQPAPAASSHAPTSTLGTSLPRPT